MHRRPHLTAALLGGLFAGLLLTGCSRGPQEAPRAGDPTCTRALAAAPATVLGKGRTSIDVRGVVAWGDPQIVLRCGLAGLEPTTRTCLDVNGAGWVIMDPEADPLVFTLYGHDPTVDVAVPAAYGRSSASGALVGMTRVAQALPANGRSCD